MQRRVLCVWVVLIAHAVALGQPAIMLIDGAKPGGGWGFGNGPEFPGATGKLELAAEKFRDRPVLTLQGDFSKGGNYVQASIGLPETAVDTLSFWVNTTAGTKQLTVRLVDGSDQCHQVRLKINEKGGWQQVAMPVEEFFKTMGTPAALDIATQYEKWGGANDGKWHQPGRLFVILVGRDMPGTRVQIADVQLYPSTETRTSVRKEIRLDEMLAAGELDWGFNLGQEFAGAKGGLELVRDDASGEFAMRLHADFTGGGAYVGVRKSFAELDVESTQAIRMQMRSPGAKSYAVRLVDATGQCHQRKDMPIVADGTWHDVALAPEQIAGGEHWGGANDGKWHGSVSLIELMLNTASDPSNKPEIFIKDIRADVTVGAKVKPSAFNEGFESDQPLAGWQTAGAVAVEKPGRAGSAGCVVLKRPLSRLQDDTRAAGPFFEISPGSWLVRYAWKARLHSPDNSYHGSVGLEVMGRDGSTVETIPSGIGYGEADWQESSQTVVLPRGAARARFCIELKKTYGGFWVDDLSASAVSVGPIEQRIERILLKTDAVGNLFLPGEKVVFSVSVEAIKPLPGPQQVMRYFVRDYWGAEQMQPGEITLARSQGDGKRFVYTGRIDIPGAVPVVGKYCELHVAIPQEGGEPVCEYSGFAVLPTAAAKKYPPEQIPFTIRNWDSRIGVYFDLSDRIGLRLMGVWGGWSSKAPYKPDCPGIDRCAKYGAKWITGTPAASIERGGFSEYSEDALRQGMTNFLKAYADKGLAMIAMGNEPHGTGDKVLENVRAYRAIYESVKAFDPAIHVIGTSVEPNEEYFKAGYQNYLDSYDFHIYEHYTNVRRTMGEYRALMKKYGAVKPIHSTELGLNSQGQTRHAVAVEMIKKFTVFFAEGGATVSWFTIQYPDPQGKARGQFGDSHCVFDCKYSLYNPRLDAITYYNMVNGICDKKFAAEKRYPNGVQAYLFRNARGGCLQVVWLDDDRKDVSIPLAQGPDVELVRIDGSRSLLKSTAGGITLTASAEPVLLLYNERQQGLADALGMPAVSLETAPSAVEAPGKSVLVLTGSGLTAGSLRISCPPLWQASLRKLEKDQVECTVETSQPTSARQVRIYVQLLQQASAVGELTITLPVGR